MIQHHKLAVCHCKSVQIVNTFIQGAGSRLLQWEGYACRRNRFYALSFRSGAEVP